MTEILKLEKNVIGYYEFSLNGIKYYILEGVGRLAGKAVGFSSDHDEIMYFIDQPLPNDRLREGLEYAKEHLLHGDLSLKIKVLDRFIDVDGERFTINEFLKLNHYGREENDRLSNSNLNDLFSLEPGESMFIHLSLIERII